MSFLLNISDVVSYSGMEPKKDRRNEIIAIIIIAAVILCGIAYFLSKSSPAGVSSSTASSTPVTTSSTSTSGTISVTSTSSSGSGYTVHLITSGNAPAAPNYKAPLVVSATDVSAAESASLQNEFAATQAAIASDKTDADAWIALGDERKEAGDYAGAAADWQYIAALYPSNLVANANLGDLYTNYLHDYPKAAAAFKAQIAIDPTDTYIYDDLFSLYTNQYPQSTATIVALLKQGIAANPSAAELKADLAKYQ